MIVVIIATTASSVTLSLTGINLMAIPISSDLACALRISIKVIYEIIVQKYKKYKKQNQKYQQTIKPFDKLYPKNSEDNLIDKSEYESLCKIHTRYVDETKKESFSKK